MKRITEISKESLDGKFVFVQFNESSNRHGIGQIYFNPDESAERYYIKQNFAEGSNAGSDANFQYGWSREGREELYELPEALENKLKENSEKLKALRDGDVVYYRGRWREVEVYGDDHVVYAGGERITVLDNYVKRENDSMSKKEALTILYKTLIDHPDIPEERKKVIQDHINAEVGFSGAMIIGDYTAEVMSRGAIVLRNPTEEGNELKSMFKIPNAPSIGILPLDCIEFIFLRESENILETKTFFTPGFRKQLELITCDEDLKNYMLKGEYYHKMQFIDFDIQSQMISFTPKGKQAIVEGGKVSSKNRQTVKVHKFFNTVLKGKGTEYDIKCFADKLISFYSSYEVKYFKGKKFAENYSKVNTREWATQSCMDRKAENFFELYTASRFRLGVIYREGEIVGRFIEVSADMGFVYNDRLYYKDEMVVAWYNSWVDEKKMHRKAENSHNSKTKFYHVDKGRYDKTITLTLPKALDTYAIYPYLDTLTYGVGKTLYNYDDGKMRFEFTDQYGKCKRLRCQLDVITQKYIDNNEAIQIQFGAKSGEYTTVENLIYSVKNGGHCLK